MEEVLHWRISVPIFKNSIILKQLGLAIGVPFGLVMLVIGFLSRKSIYTLYALGLVGALLFFTWLFVMIVYRGMYEVEYVLNHQGVLCRTQAKQAKRNRIINSLTVMLGLFSGKLSVMGAGVLAQSGREVSLRWNRITKVKYKPRNYTILLRGGWTEPIALFCTDENYALAEKFILEKTRLSKEMRCK